MSDAPRHLSDPSSCDLRDRHRRQSPRGDHTLAAVSGSDNTINPDVERFGDERAGMSSRAPARVQSVDVDAIQAGAASLTSVASRRVMVSQTTSARMHVRKM